METEQTIVPIIPSFWMGLYSRPIRLSATNFGQVTYLYDMQAGLSSN